MKLVCHPDTGEVHYAIYDRDWFSAIYNARFDPVIYEVDEIDPDNRDVCLDLWRSMGKLNEQGQRKFYISNPDPLEIAERDEWTEEVM